MTESLTTVDGRSVLRIERVLRHPPERVWRTLTEPAELATWFPSPLTPELRTGGTVRFDFGGDGTVTDLDPPRLFAYTWGEDHLRWELHPAGDGTRLVLVHTFDDRAGAASFAAGWHVCLAALGLHLDGLPADPGIDHVELHERYVAEFGLDAGEVEQVPGGWRGRFERQLTRPADVVWTALAAAPPEGPVGPGRVLEQDAGRVLWEFVEGTGHGARLVLTCTGGSPDDALEAGRRRMAEVVARLR